MRKGVYTINQLILPDESTVLPKGQKTICGNKTIIKMEKGEYIDNDLLYQNLAKKYKRDFRMDNILDKTLIDIFDIMISITMPLILHTVIMDIQISSVREKYIRKLNLICEGIYKEDKNDKNI